MSELFHPFRSLPKFRQFGEDRFISTCPVHSEKTPSFRGVIHGTKLLLTCHGCHAKAGAILAAMGLTWAHLFADSPRPAGEAKAIQVERQKAQIEAERFESWRMAEYLRLADDLNARDLVLGLDWWPYGGSEHETIAEEAFNLLAGLLRDYAYLDWRQEWLQYGDREEVMAEWRKVTA